MAWTDWLQRGARERRRKLAVQLVAKAGRVNAAEVYKLVESLPARALTVFEGLTGTALGDWGTGGDKELAGYTRLTGRKDGALVRDLSTMSQEQQCQVAMFLYTTNPLAGWMIDQRVDLLVGGEVGYSIEFDAKKLGVSVKKAKARAAEAKTFLDKFWEHAAHNVRFRAREYITTLMVTGELCLAIADENDVNGVPQLDCIDSQIIAGVAPLGKSSMVAGQVLVKRPEETTPKPLEIVRQDPETERLAGECFFWRNARILNSMRGRSELLRPADFLDSLDQVLFANVDRAILVNAVVWRLKLEGATEPQIQARVNELRVQLAKPGGVFGHNEKGDLDAVSPNLGSYETAALARMIGNHVRGGLSMPEAWFSDGGNANRATSSDQTDVAFKSLEAWQTLCKSIFNTLLWYSYDNLAELQDFPPRSEGAVNLTVDLTPVRERDMSRAAATAVQIETALEAAVAAEFLSKRTSRKVFLQVVEKLSGTAVDPDDEDAQIEAEAEEREKKDQERANMLAKAAAEKALADPKVEEKPGNGAVKDGAAA